MQTLQLETEDFRIDSSGWETNEYGLKVNPEGDVFESEDGKFQYFTWPAAMRETAKAGKRMPTDEEFSQLVKTKSDFPNLALAGYCLGGSCSNRGYNASYWSSTESGTSAWRRTFCYGYASVNRGTLAQTSSFSVRCLKDTNPTPSTIWQFRVYVPGKGEPRVTHGTMEQAVEEAKRLCVNEWKRAYVLREECAFEPKAVPVTE